MENTNSLDQDERIWIFCSSSELNLESQDLILKTVSHFLMNWNNHGNQLFGKCWLELNQILIVSLDENKMLASGCSIDKLNRMVQEISNELQVQLMDRMIVFYQENEIVKSTQLSNFWALRKANIVTDTTLVLDTTITKLRDWNNSKWKEFQYSWHKKMFGR
ncbi:MAG: hypothetical protein RL092_318 [Bacteroidota bacterium]|jgi:hypothetical protein